MNPLNWPGPAFLALYIPLLCLSLVAGIALRQWLRQPGAPPGMSPPSATPYEAALLRGPQALIEAAMAALTHQGLVRVEDGRLVASGKVPFSAPLIERMVHAAVETGALHPSTLVDKVRPAVEQLRDPLVARGWLLEEARSQQVRWLPLLPSVAVQALGLAKLMVGLSRDRPVFWLVLLFVFWGVTALISFFFNTWRSHLGDEALRLLRMEHQLNGLSATGPMSASSLSSMDVALVAGLFGLSAVGFDEFTELRRQMAAHGYSGGASGGGGGDSGGASSCGGGDGGGGDGGGGGGCGGCGGGCGGGGD